MYNSNLYKLIFTVLNQVTFPTNASFRDTGDKLEKNAKIFMFLRLYRVLGKISVRKFQIRFQ